MSENSGIRIVVVVGMPGLAAVLEDRRLFESVISVPAGHDLHRAIRDERLINSVDPSQICFVLEPETDQAITFAGHLASRVGYKVAVVVKAPTALPDGVEAVVVNLDAPSVNDVVFPLGQLDWMPVMLPDADGDIAVGAGAPVTDAGAVVASPSSAASADTTGEPATVELGDEVGTEPAGVGGGSAPVAPHADVAAELEDPPRPSTEAVAVEPPPSTGLSWGALVDEETTTHGDEETHADVESLTPASTPAGEAAPPPAWLSTAIAPSTPERAMPAPLGEVVSPVPAAAERSTDAPPPPAWLDSPVGPTTAADEPVAIDLGSDLPDLPDFPPPPAPLGGAPWDEPAAPPPPLSAAPGDDDLDSLPPPPGIGAEEASERAPWEDDAPLGRHAAASIVEPSPDDFDEDLESLPPPATFGDDDLNGLGSLGDGTFGSPPPPPLSAAPWEGSPGGGSLGGPPPAPVDLGGLDAPPPVRPASELAPAMSASPIDTSLDDLPPPPPVGNSGAAHLLDTSLLAAPAISDLDVPPLPDDLEGVAAPVWDQISKISSRSAPRQRKQGEPVKVIAITVPKGGTGKTSTSVNGAAILAQATGKRVLYVDANAQQADGADLLAAPPNAPTIVDLTKDGSQLIDRSRVMAAIAPIPGRNMSALFGPRDPRQANPLIITPQLYCEAIDAVMGDFDYILIDSPIAEIFREMIDQFVLTKADFILCAITPDVKAVENTYKWLTATSLPQHAGAAAYPADQVGWFLNRFEDDVAFEEQGAVEALSRPDTSQWRYLGKVPDLKAVRRAGNLGEIPDSAEYVKALANVFYGVTGEPSLVEAARGGLGGKKERKSGLLRRR
jgi:cellulose biosynthesis protein BcsQ